jgi:hypothetical protein
VPEAPIPNGSAPFVVYTIGVAKKRSTKKGSTKKPRLKPVPRVELPPEESLPPVPDSSKPGRRTISKTVKARRRMTIERMLQDGRQTAEICEHVRDIYRIGRRSTLKIIDDILQEMAREGRMVDVARERERHARRLEYRLRQATSFTKRDPVTGQRVPDLARFRWNAIVGLETLISKVRGTAQPIEVNHGGSMQVALAGVIAELTDDEVERIAAEQVALRRKAEELDGIVVHALPQKAGSAA